MPLIHTRAFRVRYYECDGYGHLNNANYVRYMQEAAFDALAAAGFPRAHWSGMGCDWVVYETDVEYLRPLHYDDGVEVRTWVADLRRVSTRRVYELRLAGSDDLAARGYSDWVLLNRSTGQPARVPADVAAALFPEGLPPSFPRRDPFPTAPPPPPGVFTTRRQVAWQDIDPAGHVNNAAYLGHVEECGMQVVAAHGWPLARMAAEGFALLLRRHQIRYLQPAVLGDELDLSTWVSAVRRSTALRHYAIRRAADGTPLAQVHTLGVWVDLSSGRPRRVPPALLADFAPNIAAGEGA